MEGGVTTAYPSELVMDLGQRVTVAEHELRTALATIERLRRIIHRYGERVQMATCHRPDWQQEIDDAMEWVGNNPEKPQ